MSVGRKHEKLITILAILASGLPAIGGTIIDRETFSVSIPKKWTEDTKAKLYEKNRHVFFENSESCIVFIMILDKDSGLTPERILEKYSELQKKRIKATKQSPINKWGAYRGNGVLLYGKMAGAYPAYARLFAFETDSKICFIMESALGEDWRAFSKDFILIQKTLMIKQESQN